MRGDVRVIQRREDFRFALEPREPIGIGGERWRQDLDRDLALQLRVGRPIHLPHPAFADLRGDFVDAEAGAGSEGQCLRDYTGAAVAGTGLLFVHAEVASDAVRARPDRDYRPETPSGSLSPPPPGRDPTGIARRMPCGLAGTERTITSLGLRVRGAGGGLSDSVDGVAVVIGLRGLFFF